MNSTRSTVHPTAERFRRKVHGKYIDLETGEVMDAEERQKYPRWFPIVALRTAFTRQWEIMWWEKQRLSIKWREYLNRQREVNPRRLHPLEDTPKPTPSFRRYPAVRELNHEQYSHYLRHKDLQGLPMTATLSQLVSILWAQQQNLHEIARDMDLFHAPMECYKDAQRRYHLEVSIVLDLYRITEDELYNHMDEVTGPKYWNRIGWSL